MYLIRVAGNVVCEVIVSLPIPTQDHVQSPLLFRGRVVLCVAGRERRSLLSGADSVTVGSLNESILTVWVCFGL